MIPAGYMAKIIATRPAWIEADDVEDVYSVSGCISEPFADYSSDWKHNSYWFFNSIEVLQVLAKEKGIDLTDKMFCYYEVFDKEFDEETKEWSAFIPAISLATHVEPPAKAQLMGFDVASFSCGNAPECSPLSCNGLAKNLSVNCHCLFDRFEQAVEALEAGRFDHTEPGPFRIFSVWKVEVISA
jgi:hypothetical protein